MMPNLFHTAWAAGPQTPTYNPYTPIEDEESERLHHYKSPASQDENKVKGRREGSDGFWLRAFGLLLGIYVFTIVLVMVNWRRPEGSTDNRPSQRVFSEFSRSLVTFLPDPSFFSDNMSAQNEAWAALQPKGKGFITIPSPSQYGLQGGVPKKSTPNAEGYCISMFHQLHCLDGIRQHLADPMSSAHGMEPGHIDHCLDYLRQSIMCAGDTTLELAHVEKGERTSSVDGWRVQHMCRDFDAIREFAERRAFIADD